MKAIKLALAVSALFILPVGASYAASTDECAAIFKKADTNGDSTLGSAEDSAKYEKAMTKGTIKVRNASIIEMDEFMSACEKGTFDGM